MNTDDHYLTEFLVAQHGNEVLMDQSKLDPDEVGFLQPDFGFDGNFACHQDEDVTEETLGKQNWKKLIDIVSLFPKHERVKNYISFVNKRKIQRLIDQNLIQT